MTVEMHEVGCACAVCSQRRRERVSPYRKALEDMLREWDRLDTASNLPPHYTTHQRMLEARRFAADETDKALVALAHSKVPA